MDELGEIHRCIFDINRRLTLLSTNADENQSALIQESYAELAAFENGVLHKLKKAFENART